jgi:hypothetical protein
MKLFESLDAVLKDLENRGSDKLLMDLSVATKKSILNRLLQQAERISSLKGDR